MTNDEYKDYAGRHAPRSREPGNLLRAFLVGGIICALGQLLINGFSTLGLDKEAAGAACSVSMVFIGAMLTGFGLYDDMAKYAGAGTLVPITGFANSVAAPALEFKTDDRVIIGTSQKHHEIKVDVLV